GKYRAFPLKNILCFEGEICRQANARKERVLWQKDFLQFHARTHQRRHIEWQIGRHAAGNEKTFTPVHCLTAETNGDGHVCNEKVRISKGIKQVDGASLQIAGVIITKLIFKRTALVAAREHRSETTGARAEHLIAHIVIEGFGADKEAVFVPFELRFGD